MLGQIGIRSDVGQIDIRLDVGAYWAYEPRDGSGLRKERGTMEKKTSAQSVQTRLTGYS